MSNAVANHREFTAEEIIAGLKEQIEKLGFENYCLKKQVENIEDWAVPNDVYNELLCDYHKKMGEVVSLKNELAERNKMIVALMEVVNNAGLAEKINME